MKKKARVGAFFTYMEYPKEVPLRENRVCPLKRFTLP